MIKNKETTTKGSHFSYSEENKLIKQAQNGDMTAKEKVINANMKTVFALCKTYKNYNIQYEDLVQEGIIGLIIAIEKYDCKKGYRFSTYATHWVRQTIARAIDNKAKTIRIPSHLMQILRKVEKIRSDWIKKFKNEPNIQNIADKLEMSKEKYEQILVTTQELLSLDSKIGDYESNTLIQTIKDCESKTPESIYINSELNKELSELLDQLTTREKRIMSHKLKLNPDDENVLRQDLARELKLSRERVRQLEIQAIKKLRMVAQKKRLLEMFPS